LGDNNLSVRKQQILFQAVEDYIESASPITSGALVEKSEESISSATLRNELNALEQMGYLKQLHTSSGRVPTTKGYRFFVNTIKDNCKADLQGLMNIKNIFERRTTNLTDLIKVVAEKISEVTDYPTVVSFGGIDKLDILSIKIIPLMTNQALMLIETPRGLLNNTLELNQTIDEQSCIDAGRILTTKFKSMTIGQMIECIESKHQEILQDLSEYAQFFEYVLQSLVSMTKKYANDGIYSRGATKLLNNPEYQDIEKAKDVLSLLENKEELRTLIDSENENDIEFSIGDELADERLSDCAIAKAHCKVNGENIASVGIIGPKRMDYAKISGALKFIVDEFKKADLLEAKADKIKGENNE
jgi:heat-inducible transcriptional repressor